MNRTTSMADVNDGESASDGASHDPARWWRFLPVAAAVVSTIWVFRPVFFSGRLVGDIGDSRWTIALHEHWYRVWTGQEAIRDLHYYFPLHNTLGTSDAFLVQGAVYSIARVLGFGLVNAWWIACIAFYLIGAIGVAVLSRQLLNGVAAQTAFTVTSCASYTVLIGFGHVQLFGMLAVSWIFVGLHDLVSRRHVRRGVALLVLVPPVLALSSWYATVLAGVVLVFLGLALALVSSGAGIAMVVRRVGGDLWRTVRSVQGVLLAALLVLLWAAVLWVYLPSRDLLPPAQWNEVQVYGPRWSDIWNASGWGGGVWSWLYARLPELGQSNPEQQYGFTPILFLAFLASGMWILRSAVLTPPEESPEPMAGAESRRVTPGRSGVLAASLSVVLIIAFFLIDERGLSFYRFAWFHVPGLESVRSPFRVMIIVYGVALFVVFRSIELACRQSPWSNMVRRRRTAFATGLVTALALVIFVEMQRTPDTRWTADELLPPGLLAQVDQVRRSCDALVVIQEDPAQQPWVTPIDAVILSTLSGVPTPQGHSRADPIGYPETAGAGASSALVQWMRGLGFDGRACTVSSAGVTQVDG